MAYLHDLLDKSINRDEFFKYMRKENIGVNLHYIPLIVTVYYAENFSFSKKVYL
jgi:dTDP-4-amino-4,6-dideoxygalactose transaminase